MSQGPGEPPVAELAASADQAASRRLLTVVRGEPTAAELAALTVVVDAMLGRGGEHPRSERPAGSGWAAKPQLMRPQLQAGPGAWRASALPH